MKDTTLLLLYLLVLIGKVLHPGGAKSVIAENMMMKQQLIVLGRSRRKASNLKPAGRLIFGWLSLLMVPQRLAKTAIIVKPSTIRPSNREANTPEIFEYR